MEDPRVKPGIEDRFGHVKSGDEGPNAPECVRDGHPQATLGVGRIPVREDARESRRVEFLVVVDSVAIIDVIELVAAQLPEYYRDSEHNQGMLEDKRPVAAWCGVGTISWRQLRMDIGRQEMAPT